MRWTSTRRPRLLHDLRERGQLSQPRRAPKPKEGAAVAARARRPRPARGELLPTDVVQAGDYSAPADRPKASSERLRFNKDNGTRPSRRSSGASASAGRVLDAGVSARPGPGVLISFTAGRRAPCCVGHARPHPGRPRLRGSVYGHAARAARPLAVPSVSSRRVDPSPSPAARSRSSRRRRGRAPRAGRAPRSPSVSSPTSTGVAGAPRRRRRRRSAPAAPASGRRRRRRSAPAAPASGRRRRRPRGSGAASRRRHLRAGGPRPGRGQSARPDDQRRRRARARGAAGRAALRPGAGRRPPAWMTRPDRPGAPPHERASRRLRRAAGLGADAARAGRAAPACGDRGIRASTRPRATRRPAAGGAPEPKRAKRNGRAGPPTDWAARTQPNVPQPAARARCSSGRSRGETPRFITDRFIRLPGVARQG